MRPPLPKTSTMPAVGEEPVNAAAAHYDVEYARNLGRMSIHVVLWRTTKLMENMEGAMNEATSVESTAHHPLTCHRCSLHRSTLRS
jgi:hypothetical protein